MNKEFEEIKKGLLEAIEFEKGNLSARKSSLKVAPIKNYSSNEIKKIRNSINLSQTMFAKVMGVSNKTIEAWESGRNQPNGAAARLLSLIEKNSLFPFETKLIQKIESYSKKKNYK